MAPVVNHYTSCPRCDADIPPDSEKCPICGYGASKWRVDSKIDAESVMKLAWAHDLAFNVAYQYRQMTLTWSSRHLEESLHLVVRDSVNIPYSASHFAEFFENIADTDECWAAISALYNVMWGAMA